MSRESQPVTASASSTVFIADGDASVRDSLAQLLAPLGASVSGYATGAALLADLTGDNLPAVIVADMRLPDMTGLELMTEISRRGQRIPTILLSRDPDVSTAVNAMRAGAVDFLEKPGIDRVLLGHIARLLAPHSAGR